VTVTTGVRPLAVIRMLGVPERAGPGSSDRTNSTPTGDLRRIILAIFSRSQSASARPRSVSRGSQPGCARRTSSWCTKNSTTLARSSTPGIPNMEKRGGPFLISSTRRG